MKVVRGPWPLWYSVLQKTKVKLKEKRVIFKLDQLNIGTFKGFSKYLFILICIYYVGLYYFDSALILSIKLLTLAIHVKINRVHYIIITVFITNHNF